MAWAGWLFADILLVLFIVGLGVQPTAFPEVAAASPTPTPTPTEPPGLSREPVVVTLNVSTAALLGSGAAREEAEVALSASIADGLREAGLEGAKAGMVLVWAHARDVNRGLSIAEAVVGQLPQASTMFGETTSRSLWYGGTESRVDLEIYVLNP